MKKIILYSVAATLLNAFTQICGCGCKLNAQCCVIPNKASAQNEKSQQQTQTETKTVTFKITGMTCSSCANHIDKTLSNKDGIIEKEIKYPDDVAIVKYDLKKISEKEIIATIERTGYKAEVIKEPEK